MSKNRSESIYFGDLSEFKEAETLNDDYGDGYYEEVYEDDALSKKASRDVIALTIAFLVIIVLCFVAVITLNTLRGGYKPPVLDTSTGAIASENSKTSYIAPESRIEPESIAPASNSSTEESKESESREETIISKPESSAESGQELTSSTIEPESSAETSYFEAESSAETSYFESESEEESSTTNPESEYEDISQEPDFSGENNLEEESSITSETEPTFDEDVIDLDPEIPGTQAPQ